jgi:hypothetical protein
MTGVWPMSTSSRRRNLLEVFGERDGERRRAAMATVLSADVLFQDLEGAVRGHDEVDAKVAACSGC